MMSDSDKKYSNPRIRDQQKIQDALDNAEPAFLANPQDGECFNHYVGILINMGMTARAITAIENHLDANANDIETLGRASTMYRRCGQHEKAAQLLRHAYYLDGTNLSIITALVHLNIGMGNVPEALSLIQVAVMAVPNSALCQYALGNVYYRLGRLDEALAAYHRAIKLEPENPQYRYMPSFIHLMRGEYREGWVAHEERLGIETQKFIVEPIQQRLWFGEKLGSKRLLVHTEQGLGDTLQFIRYLPKLRATLSEETRIALVCPANLVEVLGSVGEFDEIHEIAGGGTIEFAAQIPLLSLPHRFGTLVETIPNTVPYIFRPPTTKLRLNPAADKRLNVGIVWGGNPQHPEDRTRSVPIEEFAKLFELQDVHFYSLQFGPRADEIKPYLDKPNVTDLSDQVADFAETLAALDQLDLAITVDTAMCHLAGAFAKPVWTLLQFGGEWRWFSDRSDSPWYPTMRLFRQPMMGDWRSVFAELHDELGRIVRADL